AAEFVAALAHPAAPLERIVAELRVPRESTRGPLVQVLFNVYGFAPGEVVLPGVATETLPAGQPGSAFDLTVYVERHEDGFGVEILYDRALYEPDRIDRLLAAYLEWITALATTGEKPALDPSLSQGIREVLADEEPAAEHGTWSDTERELVRLWTEVLDGRAAGVADNFFDLGGTSFALTVLHGRIERQWGSRARLVDLFRYPTVRAFAAFLDGQAADTALEAADRRARARRNRAQTRGGRSWASR
ncbi:phosphopantetheine-binding protein, partial [Amycolatopsis sp. NPDC000740]